MNPNKDHYFSELPDSKLRVYSVSESLRRHLYIFKTLSGVFSHSKIDLGTKILIENMQIPVEKSMMLDLGCGYGPIGLVLAYESPDSTIYMIDINKRAIWCAKENVKINIQVDKKRIKVLSGNYFDALKNKELKFSSIYINPPIRQGREDFLSLIEECFNFLDVNGFLELVIRKKLGAEFVLKYLIDTYKDKSIRIICKKSGYWVFHIE